MSLLKNRSSSFISLERELASKSRGGTTISIIPDAERHDQVEMLVA
ncbi:MAG: hypothetical protein K2X28_04085 [Alphaproteobacteria bacterium]|nr:hypothetical protein [Alphaproteobacteria bacterium]